MISRLGIASVSCVAEDCLLFRYLGLLVWARKDVACLIGRRLHVEAVWNSLWYNQFWGGLAYRVFISYILGGISLYRQQDASEQVDA